MKKLLAFAAGVALVGSVYAQDTNRTFRTLAAGLGLYQTQDASAKPAYGTQEFFGHDLVSAALGIPMGTVISNQVLALQVDCGSTTASLIAWDNTNSTVLATIAVCTNLSVVQQQGKSDTEPFPSHEHFVGQFAITPGNNLLSGSLTIAGRLQLNPTNGCPQAVRVEVDPLDHLFKDTDVLNGDDPKNKDILRAGVGHAVGTVKMVFDNNTTNEVLFPFVALSIRHELQ